MCSLTFLHHVDFISNVKHVIYSSKQAEFLFLPHLTAFEMHSGVPIAVIQTVLLLLLLFSFSVDSVPSPVYTYDSVSQVRRRCAPILPVVLTELKPDETRGERLKNELWFVNGDWSQKPDAVPLIPSKYVQMESSRFYPGTNLVSFWVMDVESSPQSDNMVYVSGILEIGFTAHESFNDKPTKWSSDFETSSQSTKLRIAFQGVYAESDENGGTRHMCLLGRSSMHDSDNSSFGSDDQIILWLRYPKVFSLTSRGIYGQMESLATTSNLKYFDKVSVSSQLNERSSVYQFGSRQTLNTHSGVWYHGDSTFSGGIHFCYYLQALSWIIELKINPNHKSLDGELGFFFLENEKPQDLNIGNFKLVIRNLICDPGYQGFNTAKIAAELTVRTGPVWSYPSGTSGLSRKSIFAEGFWNSSEKELHMLGCLGGNGNDPTTCDYQVSLYFPTVFSIHRRSTVYGSITAINTPSESDAMVLLENMVSSPMAFLFWVHFYGAYNYSKLSLASAFKSRDDPHPLPSDIMSKFKSILFEYPSYNPRNHTTLSYLENDLCIHSLTMSSSAAELEVCNQVTSVDLIYGAQHVHLFPLAETKASSSVTTVALSGYLSITGQCFSDDVSLSVEGLYNPANGIMYLIGCKDLRGLPVDNIENLEHGQDCLIEVKVEYPPIFNLLHLNQKLKITIKSQREKHDSLHFSPVIIQTQSFTYRRRIANEQLFKKYEIYLRFTLLILALFCVTYQLRYMTTAQGETSSSYISLIMLFIQVSSYVYAVTFKALTFSSIWSYVTVPSPADSNSDSNKIVVPIDVTIIQSIFITISSEFFTLARKVWTLQTEPNSPSEIKVLVITLSIYVLGVSVFIRNSIEDLTLKLMEDYGGMVLDLFLLPQIIANILWRIRCKPLRKIYYIGFSLIRAFPRLYNHFQDTFSDSDFVLNGRKVNGFSPDVAVVVMIIVCAVVVYIQQRRCCIVSQLEETAEPTGGD